MRERLTTVQIPRGRTSHDAAASRELRDRASNLHNAPPQVDPELREQIAQLKSENRQLAIQIESLRSGAVAVLHELDTGMMARGVARQAAHLLNAEFALVELYDQDLPYFRTSHIHHKVESTQDLSAELSAVNALSLWVVRHRQSCVFSALQPSDRATCPDFETSGCRNALCVPMLNHQGYVVGVVQVQNHRGSPDFTQQQLAIAETLAIQAAIGLERTRLFDRMQEWTQSLEILLAFNAAVNQHLNPSELVRRLVEQSARFLKADGGLAGLALPVGPSSAICMSSEAYWNRNTWHEWPRTWNPLEGLPGSFWKMSFPIYRTNIQRTALPTPSSSDGLTFSMRSVSLSKTLKSV